MQILWQDLVLAARLFRKSPGFTIPAILTLALGIGANATVFSLADAFLFRTLPVADADRIVHGYQQRPQAPVARNFPLAYADYLDYRASTRSFESLAAHYSTAPLHVLFDGEPASLNGAVVTASYFDVLKLQASAGRFFTAEEDRVRDRDAVAVISDALWNRQYSRDRSALGTSIEVNGRSFTIIGVAPRGFSSVHPGFSQTDIWIPTAMFRLGYRYCDAFDRGCTIVDLLGRLREGTSIRDAQVELDTIARQLALTYPATNRDVGVVLFPARGRGLGAAPEEWRQIQIFTASVGLVLLIACANIAGLLLARATGRRREIAIRLALGAGRGRLVRQLVTESLLLALGGGAVGLLFAFWGNDVLGSLYGRDNAGRPLDVRLALSGSVIAATVVTTACAAMLFGLFPSLQASRADVVSVLKDEGASGGARRATLRQLLVTGQLALSVMLLIGTGLLIQSVRHLYEGPGFSPEHVLMLRLRPSLVDYPLARAHAYQREVVRRLESTPGILSASPTSFLTLLGAGIRVRVSLNAGDAASIDRLEAIGGHVGARYFSTIGLRLIDGREFTDRDTVGTPRVVIVNDVLARALWPNARAVGRTILLNNEPHTIVGLVPDAQYYAHGEPPRAQVFFNYWQSGAGDAFLKDARMHVRVAGDARAMMPLIRREVAAVDRRVPLSEDYPLSDRVAFAYQPVRVARAVIASFAVLAVLLSAVGLYGVLAVIVHQRTREIGVRVALGARRSQVLALVVREAFAMTASGTLIGVLSAWIASRFIASLLYGVQRSDVSTFILAPVILIAVAAAASVIPARRAVNVSPMTALRYE